MQPRLPVCFSHTCSSSRSQSKVMHGLTLDIKDSILGMASCILQDLKQCSPGTNALSTSKDHAQGGSCMPCPWRISCVGMRATHPPQPKQACMLTCTAQAAEEAHKCRLGIAVCHSPARGSRGCRGWPDIPWSPGIRRTGAPAVLPSGAKCAMSTCTNALHVTSWVGQHRNGSMQGKQRGLS